MLVPDEIRKCVAFVGYRWTTGEHWAGTGFFVTVPLAGTTRYTPYLITAKHLVESARNRSIDGKLLVRINRRGGGTDIVETDCCSWTTHQSDQSIDAACISLQLDHDSDLRLYPSESFAIPDVLRRARVDSVGVGDDVFITGLFSSHLGNSRNIPIVRVGNVAAIPEEPLPTGYGPSEAYLIEARSIGGLSGSPVFVMVGSQRRGGSIIIQTGGPQFFLLGLIHGHFDLPELTGDAAPEGPPSTDASTAGAINAGIAVVVPAWKIIEVLNHPSLVAVREATARRILASQAATPDSTP